MEEEQVIDLSKLPTTAQIVTMYQDGNFLVCQTELGQNFRHAIKPGKVLNKNEKGEWILQELNLRG